MNILGIINSLKAFSAHCVMRLKPILGLKASLATFGIAGLILVTYQNCGPAFRAGEMGLSSQESVWQVHSLTDGPLSCDQRQADLPVPTQAMTTLNPEEDISFNIEPPACNGDPVQSCASPYVVQTIYGVRACVLPKPSACSDLAFMSCAGIKGATLDGQCQCKCISGNSLSPLKQSSQGSLACDEQSSTINFDAEPACVVKKVDCVSKCVDSYSKSKQHFSDGPSTLSTQVGFKSLAATSSGPSIYTDRPVMPGTSITVHETISKLTYDFVANPAFLSLLGGGTVRGDEHLICPGGAPTGVIGKCMTYWGSVNGSASQYCPVQTGIPVWPQVQSILQSDFYDCRTPVAYDCGGPWNGMVVDDSNLGQCIAKKEICGQDSSGNTVTAEKFLSTPAYNARCTILTSACPGQAGVVKDRSRDCFSPAPSEQELHKYCESVACQSDCAVPGTSNSPKSAPGYVDRTQPRPLTVIKGSSLGIYDGTTTSVPGSGGGSRINHALWENGAIISASSTYDSTYEVRSVADGDRTTANWNNNGGWNDSTGDTWPDWVEITLNGYKALTEINVITVGDELNSSTQPTLAQTFTKWGITDFEVQAWNGTSFALVPGGKVAQNNKVWRKFTFAYPVVTRKIRVQVKGGLVGYSRIAEIEAYGTNAKAPLTQPEVIPNPILPTPTTNGSSVSTTTTTSVPVVSTTTTTQALTDLQIRTQMQNANAGIPNASWTGWRNLYQTIGKKIAPLLSETGINVDPAKINNAIYLSDWWSCAVMKQCAAATTFYAPPSYSAGGSTAPGCIRAINADPGKRTHAVADNAGVNILEIDAPGCDWAVSTDRAWVEVLKNYPVAGRLGLRVQRNTGRTRTALLRIGDRKLGLVQQGAEAWFTDFNAFHQFGYYMTYMAEAGIWTGTSTTTYGVAADVTRGEMARMIIRGKYPQVSSTQGQYFSDVSTAYPYFPEVQKMMDCQITSGTVMPTPSTMGIYEANSKVTRAQMAVFIVRAAVGGGICDFNRMDPAMATRPNPNDGFDTLTSTPYFNDVTSGFYFRHIQKLKDLNITSGCQAGADPRYCPDNPINHGEMAVFIVRALRGGP